MQRPLIGVLAGLAGVDRLISRGETVPRHDYHCPLLSLPFAFRTRLESIPAPVPYLHADPTEVARWRAVVRAGGGLNIGLAWSGNALYKNDRRRSMPLDKLLAALPGEASYWSLQKEISAPDRALMEKVGRIGLFDANDFVNTAAQISLMDAVVCVDTSVGHLAAALGKPTFILLSHSADWRWMGSRTDSPWYPNVVLVRQTARGDWEPVLEEVAARISHLAHADSRV